MCPKALRCAAAQALPQPVVEVDLGPLRREFPAVVDEALSLACRVVMVANEQRAEVREHPDPP